MLTLTAAILVTILPMDTIPATDIEAAVVQATIRQAIEERTIDIPIRTVDAGDHNIGVGVVHRPAGARGGSASHDHVSEVYHVLEGAGTLVTGGEHVDPRRRDSGASVVTGINGPGVSGSAISGGVSRRIEAGDVVIIPAGTPHWWSEVESALTYTVVRVDPEQVVELK